MPVYLNRDVTDQYLQELIDKYREGYDSVLGEDSSEDADQPIIDRLAAEHVVLPEKARELGMADAQKVEEAS